MTAAVYLFGDVAREVSGIVNKIAGIQLNADQQHMVIGRVRSRMLSLGIATPDEYLNYLRKNFQSECQMLVSLLTTHHTFFFRETVHFDFIERTCMDSLISAARSRPDKKIRIWSSACSRGQEAYSLAMFFIFQLDIRATDVDFEILATDVDAESIKIAENGVYPKQDLNRVPLPYLTNHWSKGREDIKDYVAARDSLRSKIKWDVVNVMNFQNKIDAKKFDIIFCRNVFIYFNHEQITTCAHSLIDSLEPHGRLFIGVSETLSNLPIKLDNLGYSIYGRPSADDTKSHPSVSPIPTGSAQIGALHIGQSNSKQHDRLRVVCVDDSDTILLLLKRILTAEHGFEVIGTAPNGRAAIDIIANLKPDVVTLDIHMPEMNGIQYLETQFHADHPPIVMISSVPREEVELAIRALKAGASDYVEKPSLNNLSEQADEIRNKIQTAVSTRNRRRDAPALDQAFAKHIKIENPASKVRVIIASTGHVKDVNVILSLLRDNQSPTLILLDGSESIMDAFTKELNCGIYECAGITDNSTIVGVNQVGVMHFKTAIDKIRRDTAAYRLAICVLGLPSQMIIAKIKDWSNARIILEDLNSDSNKNYQMAREIASDVMPIAGMAYMSTLLLNET